jgi:hypothetical protein
VRPDLIAVERDAMMMARTIDHTGAGVGHQLATECPQVHVFSISRRPGQRCSRDQTVAIVRSSQGGEDPISVEFYDTVLGVLGFSRQMDFGVAIGSGRDGKPPFWISDGSGIGPNREVTSRSKPSTKTRCTPFRAATSKRSGTARLRARNVAGMPGTDNAIQELLRDAFTRLIEHADELTDGLTDETATYRPTPSANSIAWLLWHSARVQDIQVSHVAGVDQVWTRDGWVDRFGLDLPRNDTGYGHGPQHVAKVRAPADLLSGYYHAVHTLTCDYIAGVTAEELARVVDTNWDPPVTASARLVSIVDDCAQHLGQAAYVRGIAQ